MANVKMVGLLTVMAGVALLSGTALVVSSRAPATTVNVKAAPSVTVQGVLVSPNKSGCLRSYYIGCYKMKVGKVTYDLVEQSANVKLSDYVGKKIQVVGAPAGLKGKNVLLVSSVRGL